MNKQLREFEKESGLDIYGLGARRDKWEAALEKYAELIVRECIREIGYKSVELLDIDFYPHYQERLKKHFGVEE